MLLRRTKRSEGLHVRLTRRKMPGPRSEEAMARNFIASPAKRLEHMPATPARVLEALKA